MDHSYHQVRCLFLQTSNEMMRVQKEHMKLHFFQVLSSKNDVSLDLQMIHRLKDREWLQKITSEALSRSSAKLSKDKSWSKGKSSVEERRKLKKVDSSKKRSVSLRDGEGGSKKKSKLLKDRKQRPLILTNPDGTSALIDPISGKVKCENYLFDLNLW